MLCPFFLTWALIINTLKSVSFCFWRTTHNIKILPTYPIGRFFGQDLSAGPQKFKPLQGKSSLMFKFGLVASIPHKSPPICPIEQSVHMLRLGKKSQQKQILPAVPAFYLNLNFCSSRKLKSHNSLERFVTSQENIVRIQNVLIF